MAHGHSPAAMPELRRSLLISHDGGIFAFVFVCLQNLALLPRRPFVCSCSASAGGPEEGIISCRGGQPLRLSILGSTSCWPGVSRDSCLRSSLCVRCNKPLEGLPYPSPSVYRAISPSHRLARDPFPRSAVFLCVLSPEWFSMLN